MRQFYVAYAIPQTLSAELQLSRFQLSWSHYLVLMRIEDANERGFYEIETAANNWSLRELKRQYHSSLYERLALSRNKEEVMRLTKQGQKLEKQEDILKSPLTLEFLGLEEKSAFSESELENANIYASEYSLYLPNKQLLQQKLAEWLQEFDEY